LRLNAVRYNALRTRSADATVRNFGRFDIIYSVGLCDYLTDAQLVPILAALRQTLNDQGVLYIAFKDSERYDKTPYQWHLDWHFYQRNLDDCLRLYEMAGFDVRSIAMTRDGTGIIMNFTSRHTSDRIVRPDCAEPIRAPQVIPDPIEASMIERN
jgi:hypothetical protein